MFSLTRAELQAVTEFVLVLQKEFGADLLGVVLYGSKARGDDQQDSDIDLLVIMPDDTWPTRQKISHSSSAVSLAYEVLLMPKIVSLAHWQRMAADPFSFYRFLFQDGLPVYGKPAIFAPLAQRKKTPLYETAVTA